ncbi:MAG TPA: WXG100 family type VII secretion target [Candidatus Limnocylindrales bacterium]|nr:WXG100 family type VII secretion target [Candidatus Limnocylindrales bacterium]
MSDYVVSVNFQALSAAAAALRAKAARFNEQVTQANNAAAPLRDTWVNSNSAAGQKYQEYWTKLKNGADKVFEDIDRLGQALNSAQELQAANETRFASQFE